MGQGEKSVEVKKAGTLATLVSAEEQQNLTALTVSGRLNSADVKVLRRMAGAADRDVTAGDKACSPNGQEPGTLPTGQLRHLDLSRARFENDDAPYLTFRPGKNYKIRINVNRVYTRNRETGELKLRSRDQYISDLQESRTSSTRRMLADKEATRQYNRIEQEDGRREFALYGMSDKEWKEIRRHDWNKHADHFEERLADSTFIVGCHTAKHCISFRMFHGCTALETIVLSDDTEHISNQAFSGCTSLKEIRIPKKVSKMSTTAFHHTPSLRTVAISEASECQTLRLPDDEVVRRFFTRSAPELNIVRY